MNRFTSGHVIIGFLAIIAAALGWIIIENEREIHTLRQLARTPAAPAENAVSTPKGELDHEVVLAFILKHEGPGVRKEVNGYSFEGVTEASWTAWRSRQGDRSDLPVEVKDASDKIIKRFYYDYFDGYHVWDVVPTLQLLYADFAVQSGGTATKTLQRLAGSAPDGVWGSKTASKVMAFNATLTTPEKRRKAFEDYDKMKREFFRWLGKHPDHKADLKGWLDRSDDLKAYMEPYLKG